MRSIGIMSLALLPLLIVAAPPAQIYIDPRPLSSSSRPLSVSPPDVNSILSHHLDISSYEYAPLPAYIDALGLESSTSPFDKAPGSLIIMVEGQNGLDYLPESIKACEPTLIIPSSPSSSAWNALITTFLGRIAAMNRVHLTDIYGFEIFAREAGSLLKDWSDWATDEALEGWQWIKDTLHTIQPEISLPVEPTYKYAKLLNVHDLLDPSARKLLTELEELDRFVESLTSKHDSHQNADYFPPAETVPYAALRFQGLHQIELEHGRNSETYRLGSEMLKASLEATIAIFRAQRASHANIIMIVIPPSASHHKRTISSNPFDTSIHRRSIQIRAPSPTPIVPINQACFSDADACMQSTGNCSGHGTCASGSQAGKSGCFVCACNSTVSQGKTTYWTGTTCQKADISSQFFLLAGSTIVLFVTIIGSISLLFGIGREELPPQLAAVGATGTRHGH